MIKTCEHCGRQFSISPTEHQRQCHARKTSRTALRRGSESARGPQDNVKHRERNSSTGRPTKISDLFHYCPPVRNPSSQPNMPVVSGTPSDPIPPTNYSNAAIDPRVLARNRRVADADFGEVTRAPTPNRTANAASSFRPDQKYADSCAQTDDVIIATRPFQHIEGTETSAVIREKTMPARLSDIFPDEVRSGVHDHMRPPHKPFPAPPFVHEENMSHQRLTPPSTHSSSSNPTRGYSSLPRSASELPARARGVHVHSQRSIFYDEPDDVSYLEKAWMDAVANMSRVQAQAMHDIARYESQPTKMRACKPNITKRINIKLYEASLEVAQCKESWWRNKFRHTWGAQINALVADVAATDDEVKRTHQRFDDRLTCMEWAMRELQSMMDTVHKTVQEQQESRGYA